MSCMFQGFAWPRIFTILVLLTIATTTVAQPAQPHRTRQFPPGALNRIEDLPNGRFRNQLDRLRPAARVKSLEWLQRFHFTEIDLDSLHTDDEGGIYYVDDFTTDPALAEIEPPAISEAAVPVSPFPAGLIFHSRPGASNVLYLNFAGENVTGTAWNSSLGRTIIPAVAFSSDGDFSTYSDSEQAVIKRVWQRVAEDFAAFDIDVTTERPTTFTTRTAHALITRNTDANGENNPSSSAGGVAYVSVFAGGNYATYRPAWVYYNNLSSSDSFIAEATSHEIGHNLGLSHDAKTDGTSYYGGHGSGDTSWGPIMGTGYNRNVSQWCKGDYYLANNTEDDLAIISSKISYRADDHGNTRATATALVFSGETNVVSTTPETDPVNANPANKGVLQQSSDVDVFSFVTGPGPINLNVNPWIMPSGTRGGNLDVLLELYDGTGALVLTNNSANKTTASLQTSLPEGVYFLHVRNTGVGTPFSSSPNGYTDYGSIGQYFLSGYVQPTDFIAPPQADVLVTDLTTTGTGTKLFTVTYTDNLAVAVSTLDGNDIRITGPNGYDRAVEFISIDNPTDGSPRVVTYAAEPPNGSTWLHTDNGTYVVTLQSAQVTDTEGATAVGQTLGSFIANVPILVFADNLDANSGWTFQAQWQYGTPTYAANGPTSGFTGSKIIGYNLAGNYPNNLALSYATSPLIDCSSANSLTLQFRRWLRLRNGDTANLQISTNGSTWNTLWSTSQTVSDTSWQLVQYALPGWVAGSTTVQLRWGLSSGASQNDIGWNFDDLEITGTGVAIPPVNYSLFASSANPAWGSVTPTNSLQPAGTDVELTALPATYYQFANWTGATFSTNNPLTLTLTTNLFVQAVFREVLTTNYPTPHWWLASLGYTQDFENAVQNLGSNNHPLWQSYIAGLNPNDPNNQLRLTLVPSSPGNIALQWESVTGRVYTVWSSSDPNEGFAPIPSAANLPASINGFTNDLSTAPSHGYYRLEVKIPTGRQ